MLPQRLPLPQMQVQWAQEINPVLSNPIVNGILLKDQVLAIGSNAINHKLGRKLQGWIVTRMQGTFSQLYDNQSGNQTPELTLALHSSAVTTVDIYVF